MDTDRTPLGDLIAKLQALPPDTPCDVDHWQWADGSGGGVAIRLTFRGADGGPAPEPPAAPADFAELGEIRVAAPPEGVIEIRHSARLVEYIAGTVDAGFVEFDSAFFPPGETRFVRVTDAGMVTTFRATGEPGGPGRTRFRLDSPVDVRRAEP